MKKISTLLIVCLAHFLCRAQTISTSSGNCVLAKDFNYNESVYEHVSEMPEFIGGMPEMLNYIQSNLHYPQGEEFPGRILIVFLIDTHGSVKNVRACRRENNKLVVLNRERMTTLEKEAFEIISKMPRWKPGRCDNKVVNVEYRLPIVF